jgi:hypothetical protein
MVRHIVLFTLSANDAERRRSDLAAMKERLESLRDVVPGVLRLDVNGDLGTVEGHWDVALVSEHEDADALTSYQAHPAHREVVSWLDTVVADRAVVDCEVA